MSKILVVEDDHDIRGLLVDTLIDCGYDVVEAQDGGSGLEMACQERPDVILLDVMMPVMDGLQVLENLKGNAATRAIPVIMVTAKGQEQDASEAMKSGAWAYVIKPWEFGDLESKVMGAIATISRRSSQ